MGSEAKRVLVVEDDDAIRTMVADALEFEGYAVQTALHGADALAALDAGCPSAIVLDLMMPVRDGWTFLREYRQRDLCQNVPILVTSAYRRLPETAAELAVQACLLKPYDLDVLLSAVEALVRRSNNGISPPTAG